MESRNCLLLNNQLLLILIGNSFHQNLKSDRNEPWRERGRVAGVGTEEARPQLREGWGRVGGRQALEHVGRVLDRVGQRVVPQEGADAVAGLSCFGCLFGSDVLIDL